MRIMSNKAIQIEGQIILVKICKLLSKFYIYNSAEIIFIIISSIILKLLNYKR